MNASRIAYTQTLSGRYPKKTVADVCFYTGSMDYGLSTFRSSKLRAENGKLFLWNSGISVGSPEHADKGTLFFKTYGG